MLPGAWYTCWGSMINWIKFDDTTTLEIVQKSFELKLIFRYFSGLVEWSMASHKLNKVSKFRSDSPACHIPKKDKKMLVNTFLTMTNFGQRYLCFAACHTLYNCVGYDPNNEFMILIYMNIIYFIALKPIPFVVLHPSNFGQFWPVGKSIENQAGKNEVKVASWAHLFCPFGVCDICHRCVFLLCLNSKYKLWKSWSLFCWSINARFLLLSLWFSDLAKCKYCQATFLISIDLW